MAAFVLDCRSRGLSPRTVEFYLEALTSFRGTRPAGADASLAALTVPAARSWLVGLANDGRRPATIAGRTRGLKVFSAWLEREGYLRRDPLAGLRLPRIPRTVVPTFSEREMATLLDAAQPSLAIVLRVLFDTGLRICEAVALTLRDVGDGQLIVVEGKGGDARAVPFGKTVDGALRRYVRRDRSGDPHDSGAPLFVGRAGRPQTAAAVYQSMRRLGARLGIDAVRVSPHTCRHTFAVLFLRNGGNLFALQKILGHTDLAMVRRYAELTEQDVAAEHRQASPMDALGARRPQVRQLSRGGRSGSSRSNGETR